MSKLTLHSDAIMVAPPHQLEDFLNNTPIPEAPQNSYSILKQNFRINDEFTPDIASDLSALFPRDVDNNDDNLAFANADFSDDDIIYLTDNNQSIDLDEIPIPPMVEFSDPELEYVPNLVANRNGLTIDDLLNNDMDDVFGKAGEDLATTPIAPIAPLGKHKSGFAGQDFGLIDHDLGDIPGDADILNHNSNNG